MAIRRNINGVQMTEDEYFEYREEQIREYHKNYDKKLFLPELISESFNLKEKMKNIATDQLIDLFSESFNHFLNHLKFNKEDLTEYLVQFESRLSEETKTDLYSELHNNLREFAYDFELLLPEAD